jgi:ATP-dependent Clp protease protease subunit
VDFIKNMKVPVYTICSGAVMSAGTILSMAGKKRYITKHTFMMIHELRTGSNGPLSFITDYYNNNTLMDEMMKRYYVTNTKIPMEEIVMILKQDVYWDAETCLLKGLVDEIM